MSKLYHYTTFQNFDSILKSKSLWLGNVHYMNDRSEMSQVFKYIKEDLYQAYPDKREEFDKLFEVQSKRFGSAPAYIFSFSGQGDDAAQWDRYANNGAGLCVKFNEDTLKIITREKAELLPVKYDSDDSCKTYKKVLDMFIENGFSNIEDVEISNLFTLAWSSSITYKHPSFRAEDEMRLCAFPFGVNGIESELVQYVVTPNGVKEFYSINLDPDRNHMKGLIEEIILGPKARVDKNVYYRYLQKICEDRIDLAGLKITESDCPLI